MVGTIRAIGNSHGIIIEKPVLDLLGLKNGSRVNVALAPDGSGILLTPLPAEDAPDAKEEHKARVRAAGDEILKRHASAFKKLAE